MTTELAEIMQELRDEATTHIALVYDHEIAQQYYTQGFEDAVKLLQHNCLCEKNE